MYTREQCRVFPSPKKNGGQTSAIFANDTRWRPNSQILHRRGRSNSRVTETARPSGVPPSAARPSGVLSFHSDLVGSHFELRAAHPYWFLPGVPPTPGILCFSFKKMHFENVICHFVPRRVNCKEVFSGLWPLLPVYPQLLCLKQKSYWSNISQFEWGGANVFRWWFIHSCLNSSPPGQNGCHFSNDIFGCILMN